MGRRPRPIEERFERYVSREADGCWRWTGPSTRGYGLLYDNEKKGYRPAHRYAYELFVGPIPAGLTLDHLCRVRDCVNPAHLEPVPNRENILRGVGPTAANARKTRCPKGHSYEWRYGRRVCEECRRTAARDYQRRRRLAA